MSSDSGNGKYMRLGQENTRSLPVELLLLTLSSCLEAGLDELESYNDAEIRGFKFEHRWEQSYSLPMIILL